MRKAAVAPIEGQPAGGLRPWREVITPHHDVASGRFQQAEFAADLGQVVRDEGADEYRNPREFFQRTFIEIGGEGGREAVVRLRNTFGRLESTWRPASAEEGYEIVRRRLFQPITQQREFTARDAVARAFTNLYRTQSQEFPSDCREGDYERRLQAAYPIHPELFDRL